MATKRRWTTEEDKILVQAIKANPHNLSQAFRLTAAKLGRTECAVAFRWYEHVRHTNICFVTFSEKKECRNLKNYTPEQGHINKPNNIVKGLWKKIKGLLKL